MANRGRKRGYTDTEKFWLVIEKELMGTGSNFSVSPFIKNILAYEEIDDFVRFKHFARDDTPFPFEYLQNKVRSEEYRKFIEESVDSPDLSKEDKVTFYGNIYFDKPENFEFRLGDKILIEEMINVVKKILSLSKEEQKNIFKKSVHCPKDESASKDSNIEKRLLRKQILRKETNSKLYHEIKGNIDIKILDDKSNAKLQCPFCLKEITINKYFNDRASSSWNPWNFYRHLDKCLKAKGDVGLLYKTPSRNGNFHFIILNSLLSYQI